MTVLDVELAYVWVASAETLVLFLPTHKCAYTPQRLSVKAER